MSIIRNSLLEFQLRPAELPCRFNVPCPFLESQFRLQNDYILRPADGHGLSQHLWCALIGAVKLPHSAQISGGELHQIHLACPELLLLGKMDIGHFLHLFSLLCMFT